MDLILSPQTVERGVFLSAPVHPPRRRRFGGFPIPPAAASAAGGWGKPGSRRVHSVGLCRSPAGGAGKMAARPEWILGAVIFLFGVGAPGSSAVDLPSGPRSQFLGAVVRGLPSPESELRRLRKLLIMKFDLVCCKVVAMTTQDGGSCGAKLRRLPGHGGAPSSPRRLRGRSGGGAPAICTVFRLRHRDPEGLFVFSFLCWISL